ncbi:MAG: biliverdin-producing heme oxygenase [Rhodospirillaceae bacterium]|nr:biliverdin-producing heme oxygenase [Rhodospirillaceae bacterium]
MLADRLKEATSSAHTAAERSGYLNRILQGKADVFGYSLLLRNLHPVYVNLEAALDRLCDDPVIMAVRDTRLYRAEAAEFDLVRIAGEKWRRSLPLLTSARKYSDRIEEASGNSGAVLAHAYTRYLGDVNGGRIIKRLLHEKAGVPTEALQFFTYSGIEDMPRFAKDYRRRFDRAGMQGVDETLTLKEAVRAFEFNVELSEEVEKVSIGKV